MFENTKFGITVNLFCDSRMSTIITSFSKTLLLNSDIWFSDKSNEYRLFKPVNMSLDNVFSSLPFNINFSRLLKFLKVLFGIYSRFLCDISKVFKCVNFVSISEDNLFELFPLN